MPSPRQGHMVNVVAKRLTAFWAMMTSSNGNIFSVTGPLWGGFTGIRWIPLTKPVKRSFGVFFLLCLNKWLSKQSWGWWLETPSRSLWRHCNDLRICVPLSYAAMGTDNHFACKQSNHTEVLHRALLITRLHIVISGRRSALLKKFIVKIHES